MTQDKLLTMGLDEIDNFLNSSEGDFASFGDTIILDDDKLNQMTTDDYQVDLNVLDSTKDAVDEDVINPFTEGTSETKALTKTELDDLFSDIIQDVDAKEVKKKETKKTERKATAFKPADDFDIELDDEEVQETKKPERKATAFKPAEDFDIELDEVVVTEEPKKSTRKATTFKPADDFDIELDEVVVTEEPKKSTRKATTFKPADDFDIELDEVAVTEEPKKTTRKATAFSTSDEIADSDIEVMETEIEEAVVVEEVEEKPKKQRKVTKKVLGEVEVEEKPKKQRKTSKKKEEKIEVIEEQAVHAEQILTEEDVQDIRTVIRDVIYKEVRSAFKDAIKNVANDLLGK